MSSRKKEILKIIAEFSAVEEEEISIQASLTGLGIDSLKLVELIIAIEDRLNVRFEDEDILPNKLVLVKDIFNVLEKNDKEPYSAIEKGK